MTYAKLLKIFLMAVKVKIMSNRLTRKNKSFNMNPFKFSKISGVLEWTNGIWEWSDAMNIFPSL